MKKQALKFKFNLNSKVSVYVPSTINVNESTDNTEYVKRVITELASMFGGATASKAVGGWVSASGETIIEDVTIVYAFCTEKQLQDNFHKVLSICETLKKEMSQEAISLEVNGQLAFI